MKIKAWIVGIVAMSVVTQPIVAMADNSVPGALVQSNPVQVTGGYIDTYSTQVYEQTGTRSEFVQTGTQQVQTGTTTETITVKVNHATQLGHWVSGWVDGVCTTGFRGGGCGYWHDDGWGPPYYDTYEQETVTVPVYETVAVGYYTNVPVYGYVWEQRSRWIPATIH